jgi:hypothetical protein
VGLASLVRSGASEGAYVPPSMRAGVERLSGSDMRSMQKSNMPFTKRTVAFLEEENFDLIILNFSFVWCRSISGLYYLKI